MMGFSVQSWDPQPTAWGSVAGWLLVLAGTVLIFLCTLGTPGRLIPGWLAYFGRISYGLYLFHSLVFFLIFREALPYVKGAVPGLRVGGGVSAVLGTGAVLAVSLVAAHLSFIYFESFFLRLKQRFTFVLSRD